MAKEIGDYLVDEDSVLGQGSDGTVYLGKCKRSSQQVLHTALPLAPFHLQPPPLSSSSALCGSTSD
jgi:hypothetical protein